MGKLAGYILVLPKPSPQVNLPISFLLKIIYDARMIEDPLYGAFLRSKFSIRSKKVSGTEPWARFEAISTILASCIVPLPPSRFDGNTVCFRIYESDISNIILETGCSRFRSMTKNYPATQQFLGAAVSASPAIHDLGPTRLPNGNWFWRVLL